MTCTNTFKKIASKTQKRISAFLVACVVGLVGCGETGNQTKSQSVLRLAVTTSTRDSGLLDILLPEFSRSHNVRVDVIAAGTGKALKLGETGDVDVVLVHARKSEDAFMQAGHGVRREDVMFNTFELLGPADDPAKIRSLDVKNGFKKLLETKASFVSRGDDSGTHKREQQLWQSVGGRDDWKGYAETGQGMGATLVVADQKQAYVLTDRGTYLKFKSKIKLIPLSSETDDLKNPYGIMVVNPNKNQRIQTTMANSLVDFFISEKGQQLINQYTIDGEKLFFPLRLSDHGSESK